jgi:hypothetical protein
MKTKCNVQGDERAFLGPAEYDDGCTAPHVPQEEWAHSEHLFDRWEGERASSGAILREQVCADWTVEGHAH